MCFKDGRRNSENSESFSSHTLQIRNEIDRNKAMVDENMIIHTPKFTSL